MSTLSTTASPFLTIAETAQTGATVIYGGGIIRRPNIGQVTGVR